MGSLPSGGLPIPAGIPPVPLLFQTVAPHELGLGGPLTEVPFTIRVSGSGESGEFCYNPRAGIKGEEILTFTPG